MSISLQSICNSSSKKWVKRYAKVEHGVEGFISEIQYFDFDGQMSKHYIMDDRGFVSSVIYFDNGQPTYQDYLDPKGLWRFREHFKRGRTSRGKSNIWLSF